MKQGLRICCSLLFFLVGFWSLSRGQIATGSDTVLFLQLKHRRTALKAELQPWIEERDRLALKPELSLSERRRLALLSHHIVQDYNQILSADSAFVFQHLHSVLAVKVLYEGARIRPLLPLAILNKGWDALDTAIQQSAEGQRLDRLLKKQIRSAPGHVDRSGGRDYRALARSGSHKP